MGTRGTFFAANGGGDGDPRKVAQFDSLELVAQFLVASVPPQEILLGFDFLRKCGVVVDLGFETLELAAICDLLFMFFFSI